MDWMTFVTELLKAFVEILKVVVWPAVVLIVIFRFRTSIRALIERLTNLEGFGVSAGFAQGAKDAFEAAKKLPRIEEFSASNDRPKTQDRDAHVEPEQTESLNFSEDPHNPPEPASKRRQFRHVSESNSQQKQLLQLRIEVVASLDQSLDRSYHVMRTWGLVEKSMLTLIESQGLAVDLPGPDNGAAYLRVIIENSFLPTEYEQLIFTLKSLRDEVARQVTAKLTGPSVYDYIVTAQKVIDALVFLSTG